MAQPSEFEQAVQNYLTVSLSQSSTIADQLFYVAPEPLEVLEIHEVHGTAGTDGSAVTATVRKCTGTQALTAGTDLIGTTKIDLKGTANTVQSPTLTTTAADLQLDTGNRLPRRDRHHDRCGKHGGYGPDAADLMGLFAWRRLREREALESAQAPSGALPQEAAETKVVAMADRRRRVKPRQTRPSDDGAA